ncbi:DUF3558 domain-containing protein [Hoyosella altamirensis]|uniref:DUF3558 domain-containing protein n=1 Tax=Hoyosella altamirensis TaxID=616997 RepID=UPI0007DAECD0|nr:DUF3558 domain-containing protein [Hoyosella altamirensis]
MRRGIWVIVAVFALTATSCTTGDRGQVAAESLASLDAKEYSERHGIPYYETDPYQLPYHPCHEIPDHVLTKAGIDPASAEADFAGHPRAGWRICEWSGTGYTLAAWLSVYEISDLLQNEQFHQFRDVVVNGRDAVEFRPVNDEDGARCKVAYSTPPGMAWIEVSILREETFPTGDTPCTSAIAHSAELEPYLPRP